MGEHDNEMAIKASKQWAEREPTARFVIFAGAGLIVNMDTPDAFNKELESLLRQDYECSSQRLDSDLSD